MMRSAIKETENGNRGRMQRNWRPHAQTVRKQNEVASKENSMAFLKTLKTYLLYDLTTLPMVIPKKPKSRISKRYLYTMFTAALFMRAKSWKQPPCPLTDEQNVAYTHSKVLFGLKKEILRHATAWGNTEGTM